MREKLMNYIRSIFNRLNLTDKNPDDDDNSRDDLNTDDIVDKSGLSDSEKNEESELKVIL